MSLRKPFKRGPVWYCEVDRRRVSLKTKDKAEALSGSRKSAGVTCNSLRGRQSVRNVL